MLVLCVGDHRIDTYSSQSYFITCTYKYVVDYNNNNNNKYYYY